MLMGITLLVTRGHVTPVPSIECPLTLINTEKNPGLSCCDIDDIYRKKKNDQKRGS